MANRKSLSKSKRFEIFKRDGFTCQYCGNQPPDVVLEIDHIRPVADGGDNDDMNLITACYNCNRGKAAKVLGNVAPKPDADLAYLEIQQEVAELKRYQLAKEQRDEITDKVADSLQQSWSVAFDNDWVPNKLEFIKLIKQISPELVERAIYIAASNENLSGNTYSKFKYMCGICWNIIRREDG